MATALPITNVTRLPTAAPRKVRSPVLTEQQLAAHGIKRILPEPNYVDPRRHFSAAMFIAQAILGQMTDKQKRAAQNAAHRFYCEFGTDDARAASAFMASI